MDCVGHLSASHKTATFWVTEMHIGHIVFPEGTEVSGSKVAEQDQIDKI
jgi:hypothetical protein